MRSKPSCLTRTWSRCGRGTWDRCWLPGTQAPQGTRRCRRSVTRLPVNMHMKSKLNFLANSRETSYRDTTDKEDGDKMVTNWFLFVSQFRKWELVSFPVGWLSHGRTWIKNSFLSVCSISKQPCVPSEQAGRSRRTSSCHTRPMATFPSPT